MKGKATLKAMLEVVEGVRTAVISILDNDQELIEELLADLEKLHEVRYVEQRPSVPDLLLIIQSYYRERIIR
jgi:hypothetical protein